MLNVKMVILLKWIVLLVLKIPLLIEIVVSLINHYNVLFVIEDFILIKDIVINVILILINVYIVILKILINVKYVILGIL